MAIIVKYDIVFSYFPPQKTTTGSLCEPVVVFSLNISPF